MGREDPLNPGNFIDKKKFEVREYTDAEYQEELDRVREEFTPLVLFCKEHGRAMRIGSNHGSLSDRILNRFGVRRREWWRAPLSLRRLPATWITIPWCFP